MKQVNMQLPLRMLTLLLGLFLSVGAFAQQITVKGHVKDATGEPIIGATVRVVGTQTGVVSDFDGNFTIQATQGQTLSVSYIGYQTAEVNAAPNVVVTLQDDAQTLGDVVVIGYGRAKKSDLTGSVTAIKPDDMNHGLQTSANDMLQGKIAGVNVTNSGGQPGTGATIRIRGGSSLNASNNPLIVIDGLTMDSYGMEGSANPLSLVNPNDIESFTVLKDASATAIYGSRASNGVIIITTKKGQKNQKAKVSYNGNVSMSVVSKTLDVMDASEYMSYAKNLVMNTYGYTEEQYLASPYYANLGYTDAQGNHLFADTDWQKEIYRTALSHDHNVTIAGGLKDMPYRISVGYTDQNGIVKTSDYQRMTASVNLSPSFLDNHLVFNINAKAMYSKTDWNSGSAIYNALSMDPTKPIYAYTDEMKKGYGGYWQWPSTSGWADTQWTANKNSLAPQNPVAALEQFSNTGRTRSLMGNIEMVLKMPGFEDLQLHVNAGMDLTGGVSRKHGDPYSFDNYYYGYYEKSKTDTYNISFNSYLDYNKEFGIHNLGAMVGYEWQDFHKKNVFRSYGTYPSTNTESPGARYNESANPAYKTANYLVSFFGRMNYALLDRYLLTATLRADGSSRFNWLKTADNQQWGLFPSAAFAWKINEEPFLKNAEWLSDLKLRLGWGITGQQEGIGDYTYIPTYSPNIQGAFYDLFGDGTTTRPDGFYQALTWEKTTTWNAGLDFGLLNDRITINLDAYHRKTTDLINSVVLPVGTNFTNKIDKNIGSLHNTGIEAAINWRVLQQKDLSWQLGYNVTWNKNEIDELVDGDDENYMILHGGMAVGVGGSDGIKSWHVGSPVEAFYTYQQVYDQTGYPIRGLYVDRNGDGIITSADRYFYKKSTPDVTMGFTSKVIWKNWDFSFSTRANLNNYVYNGVEAGGISNVSITGLYVGNAWHNVYKEAAEKGWTATDEKTALSDYFIQNASFFKLDNVTLGYSFAKLFNTNISGRVFLTAQNVLTITKYKGIDPEIDGGYDGSIYPRPFMGIFGLSLNF